MHGGQRLSDAQYHRARAEQERQLARRAQSREARERHAHLMQLHQLRGDGLILLG
jgi:hypothetical protein